MPTGPAYGKINEVTLDYDSAKRTTIKKAHNRDVVVNYRYDVDSTQLFNVNVWDVFFDASGNEISRSKRTTLSNKVLDDLGATVGFDTAKTTGSPARYVQKGTGGAT